MNSEKFKTAIQTAIGLRTQKTFAEQCGFTPQYLSRLMKGETVPSIRTLAKIAAHADGGITLETLKKICGYNVLEDEKEEDDDLETKLINEDNFKDWTYVMRIVSSLNQNITCSSFEEYLKNLLKTFRRLEAGYFNQQDIDAEIVNKKLTVGIRDYVEADFTISRMQSQIGITRIKTVLTGIFNQSTEKYDDCTLLVEMSALKAVFPLAINPLVEDDPEHPVDWTKAYTEFQRGIPYIGGSQKSDLLARASITDDDIVASDLIEGIGMYVNDVSVDKMKSVIQKHHGTIDNMDDDVSKYFRIYTDMLRNIYGIDFEYFNAAQKLKLTELIGGKYTDHLDGLKDNKDLIMISMNDIRNGNCSLKTALDICWQVAADLGVEKYGHVYYRSLRVIRKEPEYTVSAE